MAGSIVQIVGPGGASSADTSIVSSSITCTAGNQLWVIAISDDTTISSISDSFGGGANTYTERGSVIEAAVPRRLHHATCTIATGGTGTVTVSLGASVSNRQVWLVEVAGVSAYDAQGTATDTGNNPTTSASATNTAQPAFCIAACVDYQGGTPTVGQISGSGATSGGTLAAGGQLAGLVEYRSVTTVASQTANFGNAGFNRTCTVFAVFLESAPPAITVQPTDQTANDGATATFTVTETGATSYQWKKNGSNVGTSSNSYALTATFADQSAQITVDCINASGTTTSSAATLRVAFELSGTGPRSVSLLGGGPMGAGSVESYLRGAAAAGGTHTTTGALSAQAATIAGTAAHQHAATGALSAQDATIAGTAVHNLLHTSTGALTAQDATISGAAAHQHASTGALTAQDATIAGTAAHATLHTTTGALTAQDAAIAGTAAHEHAATGTLVAQDATIAGSADHTTAGASHSTSGALAAQDATVAGTATHLTLHTSTGALTAQDATIAGSAAHQHAATGALTADAATISGAAAHLTLHTSTGALAADAATISGAAAHEHATTGALAADAATIAGTAEHSAAGTHDATGDLAAQDATMSGVAEHIGTGESVLSPKFLGSPNVVIRGVKVEDKATDATPLPAQITNVPDAPPPVKLSPSIMDLLGFAPPVTPLPIETPEIPEFKVTVKPRKEPPAPDPAPEAAPLPPPPPPPPPVPRAEVDQMQVEAAAREKALSAQIASLEAEAAEVENALVRARARLAKVKQALTQRKQTVAQRKMNRQRAEEITRRLLKDLAEED